jgi:hypothetical protein
MVGEREYGLGSRDMTRVEESSRMEVGQVIVVT